MHKTRSVAIHQSALRFLNASQVYCVLALLRPPNLTPLHRREARVIMGRRLSSWTTNQRRFIQPVRNELDKVKWATFCIHENAWHVLDSAKARTRIKEYNEQTPSPQPPFSLALINTGKQQWRTDDAPDDENTAPAEQQPRSPQQILLAPVMAMMAMGSPSKSKGSPRDPFSSPKQSSSPPRSSAPGGSLTDRVRTSQPPQPPRPTARYPRGLAVRPRA